MSCKIELSRVLESVDGEWVRECGACEIDGVGTDTRVDLTGRLFIALKGDSFDAHDFIDKAIDAGAVALIVDRDLSKSPIWEKVQQHDVAVIQVHDTLRALQDLAQFWRSQLSAKVLAISGSNGKTTTKEFAKAICSTTKNTVASPASFNNHWGVPLSILSAPIETEVLILEMGMNHSGELTRLTEIASPDVALVTNVGRAHIGHFESIQQVAAAKAELYQDGRDGMIRIFNLDNEYTLRMYNSFKGRSEMMTFSSFNSEADVQLRAESLNLKGLIVSGRVNSVEGKKSVPVFGRHNVANLMAASALALTAGLSAQQVWAGLERCQTKVVGIDEGQFFSDELIEVATELAHKGVRVIIAGLDTDWKGRPFGPMPQLMSIAEIVKKQSAICMECGRPATRTQRIGSSEADILVGSTDSYEARCRAHFVPRPIHQTQSTQNKAQPVEERSPL
jgi:UDP-N-acetylmuramoyl-tripeptide--D-alanyl-D-alanine ligase